MTQRPVRHLAAAAVLGCLTVTSVAACTGDDEPVSENSEFDQDGDGEVTPDEVMVAAKEALDSTSGVEISMATEDEPAEGDYLAAADGTLIADPASFEGTVNGRVSDIPAADVSVVSVDGDLYVDVPVIGWDVFDPEDFCAPDPGTLLDPDTGVSPILTATEDLEVGETERGGDDNELVLTPYSGTVPGNVIQNILPCAEGEEFQATYRIDSDGRMADAEITGEFFPDMDEITYTITVQEYGVEKDISAPR
jgi:lipoprotein LprG